MSRAKGTAGAMAQRQRGLDLFREQSVTPAMGTRGGGQRWGKHTRLSHLRGPDETSVKGVLHARVHDIARQWYFFSFSGLKWLGHWDSGNPLCSFSILLPHCFSQGVPPLLLSAPKEGGYKKQILRKDHSSIA